MNGSRRLKRLFAWVSSLSLFLCVPLMCLSLSYWTNGADWVGGGSGGAPDNLIWLVTAPAILCGLGGVASVVVGIGLRAWWTVVGGLLAGIVALFSFFAAGFVLGPLR